VNIAAADAAVACAAPETPAAVFVVLQTIRGHAGAVRSQDAAHFREPAAQLQLRRGQLDGTLENAVRQVRKILLVAGNAQVQIHLVVIRRDVRIGDRPILAVAVVRFGLEIVVGKPQRQATPNVGLASHAARAHPGVFGACVGMVLLVHYDVLAVIRRVPSLDVALHVRIF
jgi:hypothetical protein